jgi:hypothetical protein
VVRGREDLGGGVSVVPAEAGVNPDGRIDNAATTGSAFGGRNSGIGVTSSLGDIMLGGWDQPYKIVWRVFNSVTPADFRRRHPLGNGDRPRRTRCAATVSNTNGSIRSPTPPPPCSGLMRNRSDQQRHRMVPADQQLDPVLVAGVGRPAVQARNGVGQLPIARHDTPSVADRERFAKSESVLGQRRLGARTFFGWRRI